MQIDGIEVTCWIGNIDELASNPLNWSDGIPTITRPAFIPEGPVYNECKWDIDDPTIPTMVESTEIHISIAPSCFLNGECFAPKAIISHVENLDRPPPGYIGVGDTYYEYGRFKRKWKKLFPDGLQAGAANTWDNSDADNVYSNGNNWSLGHKPAGGEDIIIPDTSGIGKCTMDENSADSVNSITINASGELELATFTLYLTSFFTNAGTFTCNTGIVDFKGTVQQDVTSGGSAFYHFYVSNTTNPVYLKDDTEVFDIYVQASGTFEIDAVSEGKTLTLSFTDAASCGFKVCTGTLLCQGNGINGVTITSASGAGVTNHWNGLNLMSVTMDYTAIEYHSMFNASGTWDVDNCTFIGNGSTSVSITSGATVISFTNNTITGADILNRAFESYVSHTGFDNIVINGSNDYDIYIWGNIIVEFDNSNFDFTKIFWQGMPNGGMLVSNNHNDIANDYYIYVNTGDTKNKSTITNDFATGDNVVLTNGTFKADELSACLSFDVQSGTELEIDAVTLGGALAWTWDDTAGAGFGTSAGTLECIGSGANGVTLTSENTPPAVYWDGNTTMTIIMDYTTVSYCSLLGSLTDSDIDNCTFNNFEKTDLNMRLDNSITSFTHNTITGTTNDSKYILSIGITHTGFDYITMTNTEGNGYHLEVDGGRSEFDNSTIDLAKVSTSSFADRILISKNHNEVAGDYYITSSTNTVVVKSSITNDFDTGDNVTIQKNKAGSSFTFKAEEASACLTFDIQADLTLEIDAVTLGGALAWTWDDGAGAGFNSCAGSLECIGNGANGVTLTSENTPPGVYWANSFNNATGTIIADYTTFDYADYSYFYNSSDVQLDNCVFHHPNSVATGGTLYFRSGTISSFNNCTIYSKTGQASTLYFRGATISATFDNIVIDTSGGAPNMEIQQASYPKIEFTNSNFTMSKVIIQYNAVSISKTHNDVAGAWYLRMDAKSTTFLKSNVTNDFGSGDNVIISIYSIGATGPSTFRIDEAIAHNNMTVPDWAILSIDAGITWTIDGGATVTVESGGTLDITGSAGSLITIVSATPGTPWNLIVNPTGVSQVRYVDVQDSDASGGNPIDATDGTSVDSLRNKYWRFPNRMVGHEVVVGIDIVGIPISFS